MWLLALALLADTVHTFSLALSPAESVAVTVTGTGDPVVLVPGLFGSAFGYRAVIPLLTDAGYRAIVVEPLGIGSSARHDARALDQAVRRSEAGAQEDPRTADQSIGRPIVGERERGGRLHGGRRARPGRDAQGVPCHGGAARAGAVAAPSGRGAVPRPSTPRNGDTRGRRQRGGGGGSGCCAPGGRRGQRARGGALHLRGAAWRSARGGATGPGVVGSVAPGLAGWLQFPAA